jgi:hypothetical protein
MVEELDEVSKLTKKDREANAKLDEPENLQEQARTFLHNKLEQ